MPPTSDEQIQFMVNVQRLLDEGLFTASYKFALLLALADLSIEHGDDSGAPLELATDAIAEKFVQYYWRQAMPYATGGDAAILQQNTDRQAAIVNLVRDARKAYGDSMPAAMKDRASWRLLVRKTARVVREMPLWRLQRIGMEANCGSVRVSWKALVHRGAPGATLGLPRPSVARGDGA